MGHGAGGGTPSRRKQPEVSRGGRGGEVQGHHRGAGADLRRDVRLLETLPPPPHPHPVLLLSSCIFFYKFAKYRLQGSVCGASFCLWGASRQASLAFLVLKIFDDFQRGEFE